MSTLTSPLQPQLQNFQTWVTQVSSSAQTPQGISGHAHIYRHAYRSRLLEALRANYPGLYGALGDELFTSIMQDYIDKIPSTHRSIRWYGDQLPEFLHMEHVNHLHPAMMDIAKLDWAMNASFDAKETLSMQTTDLTDIAPDNWGILNFELQAHVQLLQLDWNIADTWQTLSDNPHASITSPQALTHTLLIWRDQLELEWEILSDFDTQLIQNITTHMNFEALCQYSCEHFEAQGLPHLVARLVYWIDRHIFCQLSFC